MSRHGETLENAARKVQGQLHGTLSETGRRQAEAVGSALASRGIAAIYSSDLARAWESAKIIAGAIQPLAVKPEPRLRERHLGSFQGAPLKSLLRRLREEGVDISSFDPEGGEPAGSFRERVREVVIELAERHAGQTVLLVTHDGFIRMFLDIFAGTERRTQAKTSTRSGYITTAAFEKDEVLTVSTLNCMERSRDERAVQDNEPVSEMRRRFGVPL